MKGLIAFSFGLRGGIERNHPCLSNWDLALATRRIVKEESPEEVVVVAQWEIANVLANHLGCLTPELVVWGHREEKKYLDSGEVMAQAAEVFRQKGIKEVIPVAHPFVYIVRCRSLVASWGFRVLRRSIGDVRFDPESIQPWTHGPIRLLYYTARQILFGYQGSHFRVEPFDIKEV